MKKSIKSKFEALLVIFSLFVITNWSVHSQSADLELTNDVAPYIVDLGDQTTFTVNIINKGSNKVENVTIKDKLPSSYIYVSSNASKGLYDWANGSWFVGELASGESQTLMIVVIVNGEQDLMTLAEIQTSSLRDPDSTPNSGVDTNNNGEVKDDPGDEDDGDGQDVKIRGTVGSGSSTGGSSGASGNGSKEIKPGIPTEDIKLVLTAKKDKQIYFFDFNSMAMRLEYHSRKKNPDPMYFDKEGFVYAGSDGTYYKVPARQVKQTGNLVNLFSRGTLPPMPYPDGSVEFNGYLINVNWNVYPILEWAFLYRPEIFRGADNIREESITFRGYSDCAKFIVVNGKDAGSYVIFDKQNRLAEISTPKNGNAIYTYESCDVRLPNAQRMPFPMGDMLFKN